MAGNIDLTRGSMPVEITGFERIIEQHKANCLVFEELKKQQEPIDINLVVSLYELAVANLQEMQHFLQGSKSETRRLQSLLLKSR